MRGIARARERVAERTHQLVEAWRRQRTRARTLAVCEALLDAPTPHPVRLVFAVVGHVLRAHLDDVPLLVFAARLQLGAGDLRGAHQTLARAETIAPTSSAPPRWLGDVLLRLGDARRATIAFELSRANRDAGHDAHPTDDPLDELLERSRALVDLQITEGELAVAAEIARAPLNAARSGVHRLSRRPTRPPSTEQATRAMRPPAELLDALREAEGVDTDPTMDPIEEISR